MTMRTTSRKRCGATRTRGSTARRRIVRGALDNVARFHNPRLADPEGAQAFVDAQFEPAKVRERYDWLFEYDANTVAV